jgi:hypothetical protein
MAGSSKIMGINCKNGGDGKLWFLGVKADVASVIGAGIVVPVIRNRGNEARRICANRKEWRRVVMMIL